eukprot:TRINITY_DN706_c1_g1_i1.p1 TRINITY_DN706_c1_g1~~TRINITY_DN706_c1_g1_i1.p1  ORF type:complete len:736 (+),score=249.82 TRINITY_DN706_c1_g1_i1:53-2260(+)
MLAATVAWSLAAAALPCVPTPSGIRVGDRYEVAVARSGFRLGVGHGNAPLASPMLSQNATLPPFTRLTGGNGTCGVTAAFGTLSVDPSAPGLQFVLTRDGKAAVTSVAFPDGDLNAVFTVDGAAKYYGTGGGDGEMATLTTEGRATAVGNRLTSVPYYHCNAGYSAFVVVEEWPAGDSPYAYPVSWGKQGAGAKWTVTQRGSVDYYVLPAATFDEGSQAYWDVTDPPAVLPKYAFGYFAARWGWESPEYITSTLKSFKEGGYPIDAMIMDFEWFAVGNDYLFTPLGSPTYNDFSYNAKTLPRPLDQLREIHGMGIEFGGIRKPRLGNSGLLLNANLNGWILPTPVGPYWNRCMNFTKPDLRRWYNEQMNHYLADGVDFWWNDEGELSYFMFHYWNLAQVEGLANHDAGRRFFSINRAFSPGTPRYGATVWTGDQASTWEALRLQPGYLLTWQLGGAGYVTCDIGGFSDGTVEEELLVRWYQTAAFMSFMKVHSTLTAKPHFPFLWSKPAAEAMKAVTLLRYRLTMFLYSLAHKQYARRIPMFRAMAADFTGDQYDDMTSQWLVGSHVMAAPIMQEGGLGTVVFPALAGTERWYEFNSSAVISTPTVSYTKANPAALTTIPVYVRSGAVLPINAEVTSTKALPAGPLEIQVYTGADGAFTLYEDDGRSNGYQYNALSSVRATTFTWNDAARTLSWRREGAYAGADVVQHVFLAAFSPHGRNATAPVALTETGVLKL